MASLNKVENLAVGSFTNSRLGVMAAIVRLCCTHLAQKLRDSPIIPMALSF